MDQEQLKLTIEDFPIGLFSDLHSDLDSLRELMCKEPSVKRWLCVGDNVDFRIFESINSEAVAACKDLGILGVRGNHDNNALSISRIVSREAADFLYSLPHVLVLECPFGKAALIHATPQSENEFCGRDEILTFMPLFEKEGWNMVFVGHTHESYSIDQEGLKIHNLGHLAGNVFGEPERSYSLLGVDGDVRLMRLD